MESGPTKNLILRLRAVREERDLSISDILSMLDEQHTPLSESTLRRVMMEDIDKLGGFSYEGTLMPLADLLLPKGDTKDSTLSEARIEGLLAVIEIKNEMIENIKKQIQETKDAQASRCKKCEDNVVFLKKQITLKD